MKKLTALLISSIIMIIFVSFATSAADTAVCPACTGELTELAGDVNGDGKVTTLDVKKMLRHVAGLENIETARIIYADINFDSKITTNDAKTALRVTANLIDKVYTAQHTYAATVTQQADCGNAGTVEYKCSACGDTVTMTIPKSGKHVYDCVVTKKADCNNTGLITYTCMICGSSETETVPKTTHNISFEYNFNTDYINVYCVNCGKDYSEFLYGIGALTVYDTYIEELKDIFYGEQYSYEDSIAAYNEIFLCYADMAEMCRIIPELNNIAKSYDACYNRMFNAMGKHCDSNDYYTPSKEMYRDIKDDLEAALSTAKKATDAYLSVAGTVGQYFNMADYERFMSEFENYLRSHM